MTVLLDFVAIRARTLGVPVADPAQTHDATPPMANQILPPSHATMLRDAARRVKAAHHRLTTVRAIISPGRMLSASAIEHTIEDLAIALGSLEALIELGARK